MTATSPTEEALDSALAHALFATPDFAAWFLAQTRFREEQASCVFCRSDNPWSTVLLKRPNSNTGELEVLSKQCETDVLAVFETIDGRRLALHVENKLANGSFTPLQPELYKERMTQWQGRSKLGSYTEATTVLVAPKVFYERYRSEASTFESYVSHEDIAAHLPLFSGVQT